MGDLQVVLPVRAFVPETMLAPAQAIVAFFSRASIAPPGVETVALDEALGRVLAGDTKASEDHPSHARSTMDGFAIRSVDGVLRRRIVGEVLMGHPSPGAVGSGEAMRIPTGGAVPHGADAVVPIEDVTETAGSIVPAAPIAAGESITPAGSDITAGAVVMRRGRRIGAPELGLLATLGMARVPVYRQPVFGVLSTGDELVDPSSELKMGQVRDSNRYAIAGALRSMGARAKHYPRVRDEPEALRAALVEMLGECDAIVLTGGSSVGVRDLVPRVVATLGDPGVLVHGIRLKPGKPTMLAAVGSIPILGLPGNPTSSLIVLEAVARPIVAASTGELFARSETLEAIADEPFVGREGWTWFVPAHVRSEGGTLRARPLRIHSAWVSLPARATGYATIGERPARVERGEPVRIARFSSGGAPIEETLG